MIQNIKNTKLAFHSLDFKKCQGLVTPEDGEGKSEEMVSFNVVVP